MPRAATAAAVLALCRGNSAARVYDAFHPGEVWNDTDGNRIRAHQPHVFGPVDGIYYWYGSSHVGSSDGTAGEVNLYTSSDLYNWDYRGAVYNGGARPSMLGKNPKTGKYVLWTKSMQSAIADSLLGPFEKVGSYKPTSNSTNGDAQAFRDPLNPDDAYWVYSRHTQGGQNARQMEVLQLTDDWTAPRRDVPPYAATAGKFEAPAPFHSPTTNKYYIWSSHTSGWKPNAAELMTSQSMMGAEWYGHGNPTSSKTTFGTQGSHILPLSVVNGTQRLLYMADRYEPYIDGKEGSRYIFLPLDVADGPAAGKVTLHNPKQWRIEDWPAAP